MFVYVLDQYGKPLMPCKPSKARKLLQAGKAKVIKRSPFTIQLLFGSSGYKQPVTAGMDTGSKFIGSAATTNGNVVYQAQIELRSDISKKMEQRRIYRRTRRGRKTRYRKPRWLNRASSRRNGRLAPSVQSKVNSHLREKRFIESILPVTKWKVETAKFDIHKIVNPDVKGVGYQQGVQKGYYNTKAYVLARDGYKCQSKRKVKHCEKLHVHHIVFRSNGGSNSPSNLITLCEDCHDSLHRGEFEIKNSKSKTKYPTETGIIQSVIKRSNWKFEETFGYITKFHREKIIQLPKTHYYDAVSICCDDGEFVRPNDYVYYKKYVSKGDYQQTKGSRSEKRIPTGKLFGLRKFDFIQTPKGAGFVKGKRSSGYFALMNIHGTILISSVSVKRSIVRLAARCTTLIYGGSVFLSHLEG